MIAEYESADRDKLLDAPRMYGLSQTHKHLKEMSVISGLENYPIFCPIVAPFYSGMEVAVTLGGESLKADIATLQKCYEDYYKKGLVHFKKDADEGGFMSAAAMSLRDDMQISVCGNDERIVLVSRFDNLGKGASGSAVQNMNILMGVKEDTGLAL